MKDKNRQKIDENRDQIDVSNFEAVSKSVYKSLIEAAGTHGEQPALSFQIDGGVRTPATTMTWRHVIDDVLRFANFARQYAVRSDSKVAYLLPNLPETVITYLGSMLAGSVVPINPLLNPTQIASILKTTGAELLVTLAPLPSVDIARRAAAAVAKVGTITTLVEVDLTQHVSPMKRWLARVARPSVAYPASVRRVSFSEALSDQPTAWVEDARSEDRVVACFHTGGTTGDPKVVQHFERGVLFTGWLGASMLFSKTSVALCPLPLFHVFGCHAVVMSAVLSGAHVVLPSPAGFRGPQVLENFWKLIERWQATFVIAVPTAMSAMLQRPVNADVSSVDLVLCGSAPLPVALYNRFEKETGIEVIEGYGMTEATALVSANPVGGHKKIGSVGLPFPGVDVRVQKMHDNHWVPCEDDEVGEITVRGPGVRADALYLGKVETASPVANGYLRTGDLGRFDVDGYLWVTGRTKELIIRGGHNIDPVAIEDAFAALPEVDLVAAVGQPDTHAGEVPCVYVTLRDAHSVTQSDLATRARSKIAEQAAWPKHVEILADLPQTAVGKVFKPALRNMAVKRVFDSALRDAGLTITVAEIIATDSGSVVELTHYTSEAVPAIRQALGDFTIPWR
ncbi:MAG: acyl-CoA synthetase [Pseudomonadota bacterium]